MKPKPPDLKAIFSGCSMPVYGPVDRLPGLDLHSVGMSEADGRVIRVSLEFGMHSARAPGVRLQVSTIDPESRDAVRPNPGRARGENRFDRRILRSRLGAARFDVEIAASRDGGDARAFSLSGPTATVEGTSHGMSDEALLHLLATLEPLAGRPDIVDQYQLELERALAAVRGARPAVRVSTPQESS